MIFNQLASDPDFEGRPRDVMIIEFRDIGTCVGLEVGSGWITFTVKLSSTYLPN